MVGIRWKCRICIEMSKSGRNHGSDKNNQKHKHGPINANVRNVRNDRIHFHAAVGRTARSDPVCRLHNLAKAVVRQPKGVECMVPRCVSRNGRLGGSSRLFQSTCDGAILVGIGYEPEMFANVEMDETV